MEWRTASQRHTARVHHFKTMKLAWRRTFLWLPRVVNADSANSNDQRVAWLQWAYVCFVPAFRVTPWAPTPVGWTRPLADEKNTWWYRTPAYHAAKLLSGETLS